MKGKLLIGMAVIGASVAVLGGCGASNNDSTTQMIQSETSLPSEMTEGYEEAAFIKFNSPAEENGLGESKVLIKGKIDSIEDFDGTFMANLKADDGEWVVALDNKAFSDLSVYSGLESKEVAVSGVYQGFSDVYSKPVVMAIRVFDYAAGNVLVSTLGKINYETAIQEQNVTEATTIQETTTETTNAAETTTTETTPIEQTTTTNETTATTTVSELSMGKKNAIQSAKNYLNVLSFSRDGLIKQLVDFEKYTQEDAEYAVDSLNINWNEQAANKAKEYLNVMSFSHDGLVTQLTDFEGFTYEQAEYGVSATGL